jgi:hypothetical protein
MYIAGRVQELRQALYSIFYIKSVFLELPWLKVSTIDSLERQHDHILEHIATVFPYEFAFYEDTLRGATKSSLPPYGLSSSSFPSLVLVNLCVATRVPYTVQLLPTRYYCLVVSNHYLLLQKPAPDSYVVKCPKPHVGRPELSLSALI